MNAAAVCLAGVLLGGGAWAGPGMPLPTPGSYTLPVIQRAGNGWVLDGNALPRRLSAYTEGGITLLTFMYTYCSDPQGCPLAYSSMQGVQARILREPALHGRVRFVSLSFDPTHDTPQAMRRWGAAQPATQGLRWSFLTTYSTRWLEPILQAYGQDATIELDGDGQPTRAISHLLKAFLIDRQGRVREIYSTAYMDPQLMFNDIRSLALEEARR